jgi:hypothetical protein
MGCIQRPGQFEDSVVLEVTHAVRPIDHVTKAQIQGCRIPPRTC